MRQVKEDRDYAFVALANSFGYRAYSTTLDQHYGIGDLFSGRVFSLSDDSAAPESVPETREYLACHGAGAALY